MLDMVSMVMLDHSFFHMEVIFALSGHVLDIVNLLLDINIIFLGWMSLRENFPVAHK